MWLFCVTTTYASFINGQTERCAETLFTLFQCESKDNRGKACRFDDIRRGPCISRDRVCGMY